MDDDSMITSPKVKGEAANKIKDGYVQLAEKMEQVKNQVARMERKYDELYQTVKEKENSRSTSMASTNQESTEESKGHKENGAEAAPAVKAASAVKAAAADPASAPAAAPAPATAPGSPEKPAEESQQSKGSMDLDLEKMEDNPFL